MKSYTNSRSLCGGFIVGLLLMCPLDFAAAEAKTGLETGGSNSPGKVLIMSNKKKSNDPVILKVTQMLQKEGNYVKLVTGTTLKSSQAMKYGAIVIINFIEYKMGDGSIRIFAGESVQKRIVLFNAVGDYLTPDKNQARSIPAKAEKIASEIVERVNTILSNQ
jgi:hypothetical protein